jgi:two-component system response regulator RegA
MAASRILILEDDASVARAYGDLLQADGNTVVVCSTFEQARDQMRRELPDVLVTDVRLGEYNGLQLALLFRQASSNGRVIVVTGYDDEVIRKEVAALNGEFLLKPITLAKLRDALNAPGVDAPSRPVASARPSVPNGHQPNIDPRR